MPEETKVKLAPHQHECPVIGCHKKYSCQEPECGRFTYKACGAHAPVEPSGE